MSADLALTAARRQRGNAVLLLLLLTALVGLAAYSASGTRMTGDAAQLKRATDAAALAAAMARVKQDTTNIQTLADDYVRANLGMDEAQIGHALAVTASPVDVDGDKGVRVSARFRAESLLQGAGSAEVTVSSTAVARDKSLEVALALPNTLNENDANLAALRRLGKNFARELIGNSDNTWLALVPYSQAVNVYDPRQSTRIRSWAKAGALNPVELTSLFRSGEAASMADGRMPDRRANLLCPYRGLKQGDNYFWDQAPSGQFQIRYRHDLPINDMVYGITPYTVTWTGPNPDFGQANGINDTRNLIADRGCPQAALLPLSNDFDAIDARLEQMSRRFNINYAIAMGWSAMALAPAFHGSAGWGLANDLPREFDDGSGDRIKAIVFLVNSTGQRWFDQDSYNSYVGEAIDGDSGIGQGSDSVRTQRFRALCNSFRARKLKFYLIVTGSDEAQDEDGQIQSASEFRKVAGPGLDVCAEKNSDQIYLSGADFVASEGAIEDRLQQIADELRQQSNDVRLIE